MAVDDVSAQDHDLDPAAFLKSVRELSEKREREDAERYRQLEEKVQKERQERAARRAERALAARSISPEKSTPLPTRSSRDYSQTASHATPAAPAVTTTPLTNLTVMDSPATASPKLDADVPDFKGFGSIKRSSASTSSRSSVRSSTSERVAQSSVQATAELPLAADTATATRPSTDSAQRSAAGLARSGTLTWNRRPQSRVGGSRPTSQLGGDQSSTEPARSQTTPAMADASKEAEPSRDQIAASLGARDPSWFKQTSERGLGSAAFRKTQVEDDSDRSARAMAGGRRGLPGLSGHTSRQPETHPSPPSSASLRSDRTSHDASVRGSVMSAGSRFSATSTSSGGSGKPDLKALIAEDEGQRKVSPSYNALSEPTTSSGTESTGVARALTMSSSQARIAGLDRPSSPTKGMGGFVQSAMMKRTDSQNKRWSAQPNAGLHRSDSTTSNGSGLGGLQGSHSMPKLDSTSSATDSAQEMAARPASSSNDLTKMVTEQDEDGFVKPALPSQGHGHARSKSVASTYSTNDEFPPSPGSPSKRFSPLKSTWLESSLTKPESPKLAPAKNSQPSWMADLASRRAQRGSVDLGASGLRGSDHSRPSSPIKESPFGQSMLRRAGSRDLSKATVSSQTSDSRTGSKTVVQVQAPLSASTSPTKPQSQTSLGQPISFASPAQPEREDTASDGAAPLQPSVTMPSSNEGRVAEEASLAAALGTPTGSRPSTPQTELSKAHLQDGSQSISPTFSPVQNTSSPHSTDFRSQLRSRPPAAKADQQPEFLAKFGTLRKTQQEKFVAADVLKDNILRGKSALAQTGGPVKTPRRDELKEDLLAKKDEFRKAKEEGRELPGALHARRLTVTDPPAAPSKPEALAKRELLARSGSGRGAAPATVDAKAREGTPEALTRAKSLKSTAANRPSASATGKSTRPPTDQSVDTEGGQLQPSTSLQTKPLLESSKLASRFNPSLAAMLARGPPSQPQSCSGSPANKAKSSPSAAAQMQEPVAAAPLQDVRKDRAKGPKRRKAATKIDEALPEHEDTQMAEVKTEPIAGERDTSPVSAAISVQELSQSSDSPPPTKTKLAPAPGSMGAVMRASLTKASEVADQQSATKGVDGGFSERSVIPERESSSSKSSFNSPAPRSIATAAEAETAATSTKTPAPVTDIPDFQGFSAIRGAKAALTARATGDNKENGDGLPSVKAAAALWGRRPSPLKSESTRVSAKDEEASMRSAGLLARKPENSFGAAHNVVSSPPAKPTKSSRVVSGQLSEASPNKGVLPTFEQHEQSAVGTSLAATLNEVPRYRDALTINTEAVISGKAPGSHIESLKTLRRNVLVVSANGTTKVLSSQKEYTFYDESVFICSHTFDELGVRGFRVYVWSGDTASETTVEAGQIAARRIAREHGSPPIQGVRQGHETAAFLQSVGGMLITRQGAAETAPKQFILCCRKHLGHIVFDEVDFAAGSLCPGFAYLISYPLTLQDTTMYLWKGSACSSEEVSAARLTAMDLSESGEIVEVEGGAEPPAFLDIFGTTTTKASLPSSTELWLQKACAPTRFATRLFRIQQAPQRTGGLITALWNRRPSWNNKSPSASSSPAGAMEVKVEAKEIFPVLQSQLEAEGIYLLDVYGGLYILLGPLFASHPEHTRTSLLGQTLLFASDYAILAASMEDRPQIPKCWVLLRGVPGDIKMVFRHWDSGLGLWGTAGLMAGNSSHGDMSMLALEDVLSEVCRN